MTQRAYTSRGTTTLSWTIKRSEAIVFRSLSIASECDICCRYLRMLWDFFGGGYTDKKGEIDLKIRKESGGKRNA